MRTREPTKTTDDGLRQIVGGPRDMESTSTHPGRGYVLISHHRGGAYYLWVDSTYKYKDLGGGAGDECDVAL